MKYELATSSWGDEERAAVLRVLDSNKTTMGEFVQKYEEEFASFVGSRHCVMVNSGSSANLLAVAALFYKKDNPLKRGDEVIVPAVSWPTTYYPLNQYGLKLKFVDIDLATLNYDLQMLKMAITDRTKMVVAVNLLGNPNDFDKIFEITEKNDIIIFEDNCEALGACYNNKQTGTWGIVGSYSSFFSHHISTMEGGMVVTDDEELYQILLCLRAHGWTRSLPKNNMITTPKSENQFEELFRFILPGYNLRPLEMMGAIGLEQLKKLPGFIVNRKKNAEHFLNLFSHDPCFFTQKEIGSSSWFSFSLVLKENTPFSREDIAKYLIEHGVEVRPIVAGNFTKNEVIQYFDYEISDDLINAKYIDKYGFYVGNHHFDMTEKINYLKETIDQFCSRLIGRRGPYPGACSGKFTTRRKM